MRKISLWSKPLRKLLRQSVDLRNYVSSKLLNASPQDTQREINRIAVLISEVELGLSLLQRVAPDNPAIAVSALLTGYRYPTEPLQNEDNWRVVQNARFYLVRRKGKDWERYLAEYLELPRILRGFDLASKQDPPQDIPTSIYPNRDRLYQATLETTPPHSQQEVKLATEGTWYARITHRGQAPVEVPIPIPESVAQLAPRSQVTFRRTRSAQNPSVTVSLEQLWETAREMDEKLANKGYKPENYGDRLENIALQLYCDSSNNFQPGSELTIHQLLHIVGLLNVGKSTFIEILIYHLAKQERRCALIVNDVASAVRIASRFAHQFGIPAVPILGSDRFEQFKKIYEPILSQGGEDISQGGVHPAWRWFSPICPLLALVQAEEKWSFGAEPCHSLYKKEKPVNNENEEEEDNGYTCPLYYKCPRHQVERDIAQAMVWVLTPGSWIHTRVPRQLFDTRLTFAEAVYRECDFLFVDEADRVQVQLDEAFAPSEVLLDNSGSSFLNRLGINVSTIYTSNRSRLAGNLLADWKRASDNAQIATDRICHQLYNDNELADWLGPTPFTGRSLFARLVRELIDLQQNSSATATPSNPPSRQTRQQRYQQKQQQILAGLPSLAQRERQQELMQTIEGFLGTPLNPSQGKQLSQIALALLAIEGFNEVLPEVQNWWRKWAKENNLPLPKNDEWESFQRKTVFAIVIAILENRLTFLVDGLSIVSRFLDLHELSQALFYRPPRDYLPVIPNAPVGNILGFRYSREHNAPGGKLDYFRYVGVGRALLLNFPTLFAADDWEGAHTILISGTSFAPGSPVYNIAIRPQVLLELTQKKGAGIGSSEFGFTPQKNVSGQPISISGLYTSRRKTAANEMVEALCRTTGGTKSFLDELLEDLRNREQTDPEYWRDRQRILIITNSYDEADWVESRLCRSYFTRHIDQIAALRRDSAPKSLPGIRRSQIGNLKELNTQIVVAPLMALERGYNILNEQKIAAFGAALFLCRPMPVPDDWQSTVRQLNAWALKNYPDPANYVNLNSQLLSNFEERFYRLAIAELTRLNCRALRFEQLTERLVRGNVPCIVHFLDAKFAPQLAQSNFQQSDSTATSLLIGICEVLQEAIEANHKSPSEIMLARSLYNDFFTALTQTKGLQYGS
ncbi:MAG TPA: hypothetical protein V6D15_02345 [Oculatellaceae cyanobacterium]|jgi:hypothetical protein